MKTRNRNLFSELMEGLGDLAAERQGKMTLRTHAVESRPPPKVSARDVANLRRDLKMSRGLFAAYLRTNVRTLENWEQGRAKPNAQAALLIRLVQRFPDTIIRLGEI
jgi:putative transcriptional regulator